MRHEQERTDGRTIELEREKSVRVTVGDLEDESNEKSLRERGPFLFVCGVRKKYFYHYFRTIFSICQNEAITSKQNNLETKHRFKLVIMSLLTFVLTLDKNRF